MKKGLFIIALVGLFTFSQFNTVNAITLPETIRIGLKYASTAVPSADFSCSGGILIDDLEIPDKVTVKKAETGGFEIVGQKIVEGNTLQIRPKEGYISYGDKTYRGYIELLRQEGSDMTVVNIVPLESYLYGVVGKEMIPSWHVEALKAQAVCARTFAAMNLNKYQKYGFNLTDNTASQVYGGVKGEDPRVIQAVNETAGITIGIGGKPVSVFYFSSSGGITENSENVWTAALSHCVSVPDPHEPENVPNRSWKKELTREQIEQVLTSKGINIGFLTDIQILATSDAGRITKLKIVGTLGEKIYEKDNIRSAFGYGVLLSQWFSIERVGGSSLVSTGGAVSNKATVISANGKSNVTLNETTVLTASGAKKLQVSSAEKFVLNGKGYGHAVGMSQWGAKGMADKGFNFEEILKHYFTGVEIIR